MKVGLCFFLILFLGSEEDGAEIGTGGRRSRSGRLRHRNTKARNSDGMIASLSICRWERGNRPGPKSPRPLAGTFHHEALPRGCPYKEIDL